jgi:hypothetical protein
LDHGLLPAPLTCYATGEWLAAAANTNAHTYEVAPVFTLAETEVLARFAHVIGGAFAKAHDGLFVPGGSISNLYGAPEYLRLHEEANLICGRTRPSVTYVLHQIG